MDIITGIVLFNPNIEQLKRNLTENLKYSNKIVFIGISVSIIGLLFLVILLYYIKFRRERLREDERKNVEIC